MLAHKDKQDGSWYNKLCCMCIFSYQPEILDSRRWTTKVIVLDENSESQWNCIIWVSFLLCHLINDMSVILSRMKSKNVLYEENAWNQNRWLLPFDGCHGKAAWPTCVGLWWSYEWLCVGWKQFGTDDSAAAAMTSGKTQSPTWSRCWKAFPLKLTLLGKSYSQMGANNHWHN